MLPRLSHAVKGSSVAQNQQRMRARPTSCWSWFRSCSDGDSGNEDNKEEIIQQPCDESKESEDNLLIRDENDEKAVKSKDEDNKEEIIQQLCDEFKKSKDNLLINELFEYENGEKAVKSKDDLIQRVGNKMIKAALSKPPPPEDVEGSLDMPGIYVYHVKCLTVKFVDPCEEWMKQDWCVVKVGKSDGHL